MIRYLNTDKHGCLGMSDWKLNYLSFYNICLFYRMDEPTEEIDFEIFFLDM